MTPPSQSNYQEVYFSESKSSTVKFPKCTCVINKQPENSHMPSPVISGGLAASEAHQPAPCMKSSLQTDINDIKTSFGSGS